ncbi:MAG: hypothetical protein ACREPA_04615 [Candidatus Dormibacteraceae bacterium]
MPRPEPPLWVRIGGGLQLVPGGQRHGPADRDLPPPGGPWLPLQLAGRLVGWASESSLPLAGSASQAGERLVREQRTRLLSRLDHKLRSSLLVLQESARSATFGRTEMLELLNEQAQDVTRRASALASAALDPKEPARAVGLAAVLQLAARGASVAVPPDAVVWAPEPVLVEALTRLQEWLGGERAEFTAVRVGHWWHLTVAGSLQVLQVPELGEPLIRLLVDTHLEGWLDVRAGEIGVYLPADGG